MKSDFFFKKKVVHNKEDDGQTKLTECPLVRTEFEPNKLAKTNSPNGYIIIISQIFKAFFAGIAEVAELGPMRLAEDQLT